MFLCWYAEKNLYFTCLQLVSYNLFCVLLTTHGAELLHTYEDQLKDENHKSFFFTSLSVYSNYLSWLFAMSVLSGCEDIILEELSPSTLLPTLEWSSLPHGSDWVYRQAMHFLQEEFVNIAQSDMFTLMPRKYLIEALKSDFLQVCVCNLLPVNSGLSPFTPQQLCNTNTSYWYRLRECFWQSTASLGATVFFILTTLKFNLAVKLWGEIEHFLLLGVKGFIICKKKLRASDWLKICIFM